MSRVKALRGVCVGVERHLVPGEIAELHDPGLTNYLVSIGAVEVVPDAPVEVAPELETAPIETIPKSPKPGKKEK